MENYIKRMDELIAAKKSRGSKFSKKDTEEYSAAWLALIKAEGAYTDTAEKYFYDGFIFTGAKPFVKWVLESEEPFSSLNAMIRGNLFGKDTSATFRCLVSVLANLLLANLNDVNLICPVIKAIPSQSKNKEKKTIGNAHKILLQYYVDEMNFSVHFPALKELTVNPAFIHEFVALMDELVERLKTTELSKKQMLVIAGTMDWLHPEKKQTMETISTTVLSEKPVDEKKEVLTDVTTNSQSDHEDQKQEQTKDSYIKLTNLLTQVCSLVTQLETQASTAEKNAFTREADLRHEIDLLKSQQDEAMQRAESLKAQLDERNSHIATLNCQIRDLEKTIEGLRSEVSAKETEISNRTQMMEALSRDRARQSDEVVNRLASKLKVEYRDFMDAQELPMDADLGENMREQLKNIFSILEKAGIALK